MGDGIRRQNAKQARKRAIEESARTTHAALVATMGVVGAPTLAKVKEDITHCLDLIERAEEIEDDGDSRRAEWFHWGGFLMHYERFGTGPWPSFTIYVAGSKGHFWHPKEPG